MQKAWLCESIKWSHNSERKVNAYANKTKQNDAALLRVCLQRQMQKNMNKLILILILLPFSINNALACEIDGHWRLQSDETYFSIRFNSDGYAAVTMGKVGGPLTASLLNWSCENGVLKITDQNGVVFKEPSNMKRAGNKVSAHNGGGEIEFYEVTSSNKTNQTTRFHRAFV